MFNIQINNLSSLHGQEGACTLLLAGDCSFSELV